MRISGGSPNNFYGQYIDEDILQSSGIHFFDSSWPELKREIKEWANCRLIDPFHWGEFLETIIRHIRIAGGYRYLDRITIEDLAKRREELYWGVLIKRMEEIFYGSD